MTSAEATSTPTERSSASTSRAMWRWLVPPSIALLSVLALFVVYLITTPDGNASSPPFGNAFEEALALLAMLAPTAAVVVVVALLVLLTVRFAPRGLPVAAVMSVLVSATVVYGMVVMMFDDSSTGGLLFLFLPIELALALIPFVLGTMLVHWLRGRRHQAGPA